MPTFDVSKLVNKIVQDIPGINTVLKALAKWDVSALTDVPDGAMQATTDSSNRLTIKKKISGSYVNVGQIQHSADMVDGYHASASATANTVAVRNAQGALPGNVLGNAATANAATALAPGSVLPISQGGTGGTTASDARSNIGAAGAADFNAHVVTAASPSVTGHMALDALAANGSATAAPGGFGLGVGGTLITDWDAALKPGWYASSAGANGQPLPTSSCGITFAGNNSLNGYQWVIAGESNDMSRIFTRKFTNRAPSAVWRELPNGITDDTNTASSTIAASATAVKTVNESALHLAGTETITGAKTIKNSLKVLDAQQFQQRSDCVLGTAPSTHLHYNFDRLDATGAVIGQFQTRQDTSNNVYSSISCVTKKNDGTLVPSRLQCWALQDGTAYAECPTPSANATSNQITTAEWVRSHSSMEQPGDVIASFASFRPGCLLMHGATVSRTTYAALFSVLGTRFGAGDGSTTFTLPDARGRSLVGANNNLGTYLAAALPEIYGALSPFHGIGTFTKFRGAFQETSISDPIQATSGSLDRVVYGDFRASRYNNIYGAANTVRTPSLTLNFFIKY